VTALILVGAMLRPIEIALAVVLMYALVQKVRSPRDFARTIVDYDVLPASLSPLVALIVLTAEATISMALVANVAAPMAGAAAVVLFGAFLVALASNMSRGRRVSCGCFGEDSEEISGRSVARVALLLIASAAIAVVPEVPRVRDASALPISDAALALATLVSGAWLLRADDLVQVVGMAVHRQRGGA
jgi:hypothetical protein